MNRHPAQVKNALTIALNLTPQAGRFFAKDKGAKNRPTCYAVYAGVRQNLLNWEIYYGS
jgi:hypothetical protein